MNKRHIIGISGYARAGKDTLADSLLLELSHRGNLTAKLKFATSLKRALTRACADIGITVDFETDDPATKARIRDLMVEFGRTCRSFDQDCFVKKTISDMDKLFNLGLQVALVSDLRYTNEGRLMREYALSNKIEYTQIDIHRTGTFAANQEEFDSISDLLDENHANHWFVGLSFNDRDVAGIHSISATIADRMARDEDFR